MTSLTRMENDAEQLFAEHQQALRRFALRLTGDADAAADVVQETFARLLERSSPQEVHRGWLYKVAANVALDMLRTQRRRWWILKRAPDRAPIADPIPSADAVVEANERRTMVARALATLSERDRLALLMREDGFTHREIAEAIGTTTGSVGTIVARALERLARRLPLDASEI